MEFNPTREEIQKAVEEYLASGKAIKVLEPTPDEFPDAEEDSESPYIDWANGAGPC